MDKTLVGSFMLGIGKIGQKKKKSAKRNMQVLRLAQLGCLSRAKHTLTQQSPT